MRTTGGDSMISIGLGFRAVRGGSVVVAVGGRGSHTRVVASTFLATAAAGDRLSLEPYHVAAELAQAPGRGSQQKAAAAVAEGRKRQNQLAVKGLDDILLKLQSEKYQPVAVALLVNRAGWVTDLLQYSLGAPEHPPVAEGLAVRDALRFALAQSGFEAIEMDEKSLHDVASKQLRLSLADLETRLKNLGATAGKPWRKEQKLACLSAWLAVTAQP